MSIKLFSGQFRLCLNSISFTKPIKLYFNYLEFRFDKKKPAAKPISRYETNV
jgi:hypothetical protein